VIRNTSRYALAGKVALVTGAARGIGFAIAQRLGQEGCRVVLNDINATALDQATARLASTVDLLGVAGNVASSDEVHRLFNDIAERFGGVDILINNAAAFPQRRWLSTSTVDEFDQVMQTNTRSVYLCTRAAGEQMARRGGGAIVNVSSVAAARAFRGYAAYVASKGAIDALTRALALDLAAYNIRVNAVGPGMVATEAWQRLDADEITRRRTVVPLQREGQPADIAGAVAFLVSPDAAYITGQTLYVDGGMLAQNYSACAEMPFLIDAPPEQFELSTDRSTHGT